MSINKKIIASLVVSCFIINIVQARTFLEIQEDKTLKVGVPGDYAPLAFFDKEELVGFDIDLIKAYADKNNWQVEFIPTSWPTVSQDLKGENFDIAVGGITHTEKRAEEFLLSDEILPNGKIGLARCSISGEIDSFDKINHPDITLIVNPGGTNEDFVNERIDKANIVRVNDNFKNIQGLRDQTADVMITDLIEGQYYQYTEPNILCMATTEPFDGTQSYKAYMINKENIDLLDDFNKWFRSIELKDYTIKWGIINN